MALTDFDYLATRNQIIAAAFEIVGVIEAEQSPTAEQLVQGTKVLQTVVKSWSNDHLFLWSFDQSSFATVAAQEAYTTADLSGDDDAIIGLDKAWVVQSSEDIALEVVSYSRYLDIYNKDTSSGRPEVIAFKPTPDPSFYVWPSPDAIYTIKTLGIYPLKDFDTAAGSGDLPARFQEALIYALADRLFDRYPGPMNERLLIQGKAAEFFRKAKNADAPVETTDEVEGFYDNRRC